MPFFSWIRLIQICVCSLFGLAACTPPRVKLPEEFLPKAKIRIVATTTHLADIAKNIGGDAVLVDCLAAPVEKINPDDKSPPPPWVADPVTLNYSGSVRLQLASASLVLANGLGIEPWLDASAKQDLATNQVKLLIAADTLPKSEIIFADGDTSKPDPSIWNSPRLMEIVAEELKSYLCKFVDERAAPFFETNCTSYRAKLREIQRWAVTKIAESRTTTPAALISHDCLGYLGRDLNVRFLPLKNLDGSPSKLSKADQETWLANYGVNVLHHDICLSIEDRGQITSDYLVTRPRAFYSRWLARPNTLLTSGGNALKVDTYLGAYQSIIFAFDGRRLGGERRLGQTTTTPTATP
jgi:ABC-type Zn uptake system ZnuABC Zn-binding protein ZnuA